MECKSIQSVSSSSSRRSYDVFVSFRGEDTRNNFTDHLFAAFQRKGIVAFRDDTNLKQGEHISTELIQAIEGSRVLVVVFSKNYANSSWCLRELAKIVDCMKVTGQSVLPVFYDVSPSEVRKQSGDYGKAFAEHEERSKQDLGMVQRWREALKEVADLAGSDAQNKPQYGEIEKIVERVRSILGNKLSSLDGLVGMYSRVEQLEKLMAFDSSDNVRVVGICGMGGIGKTTLARAVYDRNFDQYGAHCFIDDISKIYHNDGPIAAQKQLICQTLKEKQEIYSIAEANYLIRTRLCLQKTLIVLDNVDKVDQLQKLGVTRDCLSAGSRVIVISRDRHILNVYGMDEVYDAQLLNVDEARQLFCRKAFKCDYLMSCDDISRQYEWLTDLALDYAQGLPLAIEVLGSYLYGRDISEWRSALAKLRDNPKPEIMDVLQISFDGLDAMEKEIFLDIACLFNRKAEEIVKGILNCCGFYPEIGIGILIDRSLISIIHSTITMHDKLQELGMKIVRQNAPREPWKWSRIWRQEDFQLIMPENMVMENVEAINFQFESTQKKKLRADVLSRMNRLRVLVIMTEKFSGSFTCHSNELRYLYWNRYPFTYFSSRCQLIKLVELHLPVSKMKKLWEGKKALDNLKIMDLNNSKSLVDIPDLGLAPNLERLNLEGCTKLVHIHPSIGLLKKLAYLNLKNCTSLQSLPHTVSNVSSLKTVNLRGCSKLFRSTSDAAIQCQSTLPLHFLNFRGHNDKVGSMTPSDLAHISMLRKLVLSYCNLVNIPEAMASLYCLEELYLAGNNFVKLPCFINKFPRLIRLDLDHCKQLTSLSDEFPLCAGFPVPEELVFGMNERARAALRIFNCPKLVGMEGWTSIAISWMIRYLKVHKETCPDISVIIPGTQIPSWFNCQSVSDTMDIELCRYVHDCNWIGVVVSVAFVTQCLPYDLMMWFHCCLGIGLCLCDVARGFKPHGVTVESSVHHLCLAYLTRQQLIDLIGPSGARDPVRCKFIVRAEGRASEGGYIPWPFKVKHWGMHNVFKQDLEEHNGDE